MSDYESKVVQLPYHEENIYFHASPAQFGPVITEKLNVLGVLKFADPEDGCSKLSNLPNDEFTILVFKRGNCMFLDKVIHAEESGAVAAIIIDNEENTSIRTSPIFQMSGDGKRNASIPAVFLYSKEGASLTGFMREAESGEGEIAYKQVPVYIGSKEKKKDWFESTVNEAVIRKAIRTGGRADVNFNLDRLADKINRGDDRD